MNPGREDYWRVRPVFNYEECMAAVTEDVQEETQTSSIRYTEHEEAIERLAFHRGLLDQPQMHAYSALMVALSELESVVLDRLGRRSGGGAPVGAGAGLFRVGLLAGAPVRLADQGLRNGHGRGGRSVQRSKSPASGGAP